MTSARLALPEEIVAHLDLSLDSERDAGMVLTISIDALNVAASVITVATLKQQLPELAQAIRAWARRHPAPTHPTLSVHGPGIDLKLSLPPNVSSRTILEGLAPLLSDEKDGKP